MPFSAKPTGLSMATIYSGLSAAIKFANDINAYSPLAFYDANSSTLYQANTASGDLADADGDVVGYWEDLSGNGYHATQGTTANKPTYKTNTFGGLSAIDPDGGDNMLTPIVSASGSYTFYVVVDLQAADLDNTTRFLFDTATGRMILGFENSDTDKWSWFDDSWHNPSVGTESPGQQVVTWRLESGGNGEIWRNNTSLGTEAYTAKAISSSGTRIFSQNAGAASFWNSPVATFIVFNTAHSTATREAIQTILNNRYGVY